MSPSESFSLRPMSEGDLQKVLRWRNSERIRAVSFTDHEISWEEHLAWYELSKDDDSMQPMVFEHRARPIGVVNFVRIDRRARSSEWGFYMGERNGPKNSALAMGFIALDYAFHTIGLLKVVGRSFVSNKAALRYHERLGFRVLECERVDKGGETLDVVRLGLTGESWEALRPALERRLYSEE